MIVGASFYAGGEVDMSNACFVTFLDDPSPDSGTRKTL